MSIEPSNKTPTTQDSVQLQFLGAAGTVTGSKFLLSCGEHRIMIDCGLYQGLKQYRLKNWDSLEEVAGSLDGMVLTHAHLDHCGYIPKLIREGFRQKIYCTPATFELSQIILLDSGKLQEQEADYANRRGFSKHDPALPLYSEEEAHQSLNRFTTKKFLEKFQIGPFQIQLYPAGHILGAASVFVEVAGQTFLFSGDLGRDNDLLMPPPQPPKEADFVVMESTYGGREHAHEDPIEALRAVLKETLSRQGTLVIPSFAVGRAQTILYCLNQIFKKYPELKVPVFLNSPMATDATEVFLKFHDNHKLNEAQCWDIFMDVHFVNSVEESIRLNENKDPKVIVSASGMLTGGRVLHHLRAFGGSPENGILLIGHQAEGTRGASLAQGARELKIHGQYHPIRAQLFQLELFSAHADQPGLLVWLKKLSRKPKKVFLVHGEPGSLDALRVKVQHELGVEVVVPNLEDTFITTGTKSNSP